MNIPTSFTVGQQLVEIEYKDQCDMPTDHTLGRIKLSQGKIQISKDQTDSSKMNTFVHECIHAALDTAGYSDLSSDETFVCTMAAMFLEIINTSKYGD